MNRNFVQFAKRAAQRAGALVGVGLSAAVLMASNAYAVLDTADIVTEIEGAVTPITAVATAVITLTVAVKVYKYIQRAL